MGLQLETHPCQQVATLGSRHRQISLLQLGEPTVRPSAAEAEVGFGSRGERELGAAGQLVDDHRQGCETFTVSQHMDVVEHEDEGPPPSAHGARQPGEQDRRITDVRLNSRRGHLPGGFLHLVERVDHRPHEQCGIVVGVNEPYPDERPIVLGGPLGEQGRLAVARWGGQQHERGRARLSQARHQSWSPHQVGAKARRRLTRDDPTGARQLDSRVDGCRRSRRRRRLEAGSREPPTRCEGQLRAHWIELTHRKPTFPVELSGVFRPRAPTR